MFSHVIRENAHQPEKKKTSFSFGRKSDYSEFAQSEEIGSQALGLGLGLNIPHKLSSIVFFLEYKVQPFQKLLTL